jgi:hypothetical protein
MRVLASDGLGYNDSSKRQDLPKTAHLDSLLLSLVRPAAECHSGSLDLRKLRKVPVCNRIYD